MTKIGVQQHGLNQSIIRKGLRGGGIAKRGRGRALQQGGALVAQMAKQGVGQALQLQEGGLTGAELKDRIGRILGRRTKDAEGRAMMRPKGKGGKAKKKG